MYSYHCHQFVNFWSFVVFCSLLIYCYLVLLLIVCCYFHVSFYSLFTCSAFYLWLIGAQCSLCLPLLDLCYLYTKQYLFIYSTLAISMVIGFMTENKWVNLNFKHKPCDSSKYCLQNQSLKLHTVKIYSLVLQAAILEQINVKHNWKYSDVLFEGVNIVLYKSNHLLSCSNVQCRDSSFLK